MCVDSVSVYRPECYGHYCDDKFCLGIEAEPQSVERTEEDVAIAGVVVGLVQRPPCRLDADTRERLGRERHRLLAHHLQFRAFRRNAFDHVQAHVGGEARGAHPQAGEPVDVGDSSTSRPPQCAQNRLLASMAPAQRWLNRMSSSCGNVMKKWAANLRNVSGRSS